MARWHSCNVLHTGADRRRVWQFDARNRGFALNREESLGQDQPLPYTLVTKTWRSLWQGKLNVAWLPPESVFLRVAQLPKSSFAETRAMVELQLEKLSPIPVTQAVWSLQLLPDTGGDLQTAIVICAERKAVEDFLGKLEGDGYLPDRLEVPVLDQLQATRVTEDGAWIYPEAGGVNTALAAWWYGGTLRELNLLSLPVEGDRALGLRHPLTQIAWAGELEGWLTSPPAWHLVAEEARAAEWEPLLRQAVDEPVQVAPPVPPAALAALTARRAVEADSKLNLLPSEFLTRYRLQFQDRLWMRGLGALVAVYLVGVLIYGALLFVQGLRAQAVEKQIKSLGTAYTNAQQTESRFQVLKDRQELKFAALDCWKAVAELLPQDLVLDNCNFNDGRKLTLNGTAPKGQDSAITTFGDAMCKHIVRGQPLFDTAKCEPPRYSTTPGGGIGWSFTLELKRVEVP